MGKVRRVNISSATKPVAGDCSAALQVTGEAIAPRYLPAEGDPRSPRDRILSVFEGAAEIQAQVIARGLLGRRN